MNNTKYNISAFSIVEVLVSMAITGIIIGIVFTVFTIVSEQLLNFKEQNQYISDYNRFSYAVNKDIFDSEEMISTENGLIFKKYNGDEVVFEKQDSIFLRKAQTFVDTFQFKVSVLHLDTLRNNSRSKIFQRVSVTMEVNKMEQQLRFYKPIYTNQLIRNEKE
jgi:type II secretory pathway pseudopilin PulG